MSNIWKPVCILVCCVIPSLVNAQSVGEIVDKYVTALGGKDKLKTLMSVKMDGNMNVQGTDVDITVYRKQMVGPRLNLMIMGSENYRVSNMKKGAVYMPVQGMTAPVPMSEEQVKSAVYTLDIQGPLFDYEPKGNKVELIEKKAIDNKDCFGLKLTDRTGNIIKYYIDTSSGLILETVASQPVNGQLAEFTSHYGSYKKNAAGFMFAYQVTNAQGVVDFTNIETNKFMDDNLFVVP